MQVHANATLGPAGRLKIVRAIESGMSQKQAAACFCVSPSTVNRWWRRWQAGRGSLACLEDRSSRPRRSPAELPEAEQRRICEVRERTGWGARLIAGVVCRPHSTVHATPARHGRSRGPKPPREAVCRYEWPCPGDLLHMDVKRYARFERPGHAVTGNRFVESRGAAMSSPARSSTTTPGSPTPSYSATSAPTPSSASSPERSTGSPARASSPGGSCRTTPGPTRRTERLLDCSSSVASVTC